MSFVLGVPTYRRYDLCAKMIASAEAGLCRPNSYVVVDNGGKLDPTVLPQLEDGRMNIVRPKTNLGVAGGWNRIMSTSPSSDVIVITNDDVIFGPKTLAAMVDAVRDGAPMAVATEGQSFSCFAISPALYEKVGPFDERFYPAYFEDTDYHWRMKLVGKDFVVISDEARVGYVHAGSATMASYTKDETDRHHELFRANKRRYIAKWGGPPHQEQFREPMD